MTHTQESARECVGYYKLDDLASAQGLVGDGGNAVMLQAETQSVRIRLDGVNPDSTTGMLLTAGTIFWFVGDLSRIRVIQSAASAVLHATVFK